MSDLLGIVFVAVVVAVGVATFLAYYYSKDAKTRRALRSQPRTLIADAIDGMLVKIVGRVRLVDHSLEAPLSGRRCAAWEVVVEEQKSRGKTSHWQEIIHDQDARYFLLEDESGKALVEAAAPRMALEQDARFRSGTFDDASPELERFLASHGRSSTGLLGFNRAIRYREGAVEEGELVAVFGRCRWEHDPDPSAAGPGYRTSAQRLVIVAPSESPLLISDDLSVGE